MKKRILLVSTALLGFAIYASAQQPAADTLSAGSAASRDSVAVVKAAEHSAKDDIAVIQGEAGKSSSPRPYWQGWFGELSGMAGSTAVFPSESSSLKDNRGFLFNGSALVSAWSDKDQFTFVAGGNNVNESEADVQGVTTAAQSGLNFYTGRLKDMETTVTANYKFSDTNTGSSSELNEFSEEEFTSSSTTNSGNTEVHSFVANAELKKEKGKVWFHVKPLFRYTGTLATSNSSTRTMAGHIEPVDDEEWRHYQEEQERIRKEQEEYWKEEMQHMKDSSQFNPDEWQHWMDERDQEYDYEKLTRYGWKYFANESRSQSTDNTGKYTTELNADMTVREIAGKKDRNLRFGLTAGLDSTGGAIDENSEVWTSSGEYDQHLMHYDVSGFATRLGGSVNYAEPLAPDWMLTASADVAWTRSSSTRSAFENGAASDLFSSLSEANSLNQKYDITAQYKFGAQNWVSFGGNLTGVLNETYSVSKNVEETTGNDDWYWYFTPTAKFQYVKDADRFTATLYGNTQRPGTTQMLPVLDLRIASRPGIGNIYLKPYSSSTGSVGWTHSNKERASSLSVSLSGSLNFNPIIYARWFDADKRQYSLPVNSHRPGLTTTLSASYNTALDANKFWTLAVNGSARYNTSVGYQALTALPAVDRSTFDYSTFMADYWGDATGDVFYSGRDFTESITRLFQPQANLSLKYARKHFNATLGTTSTGRISRYSLNPLVNVNTLDTRVYAAGAFSTDGGFEVKSSFAYVFYLGYTEGFGLPEYQWNAEMSQKLGDFTFSFKAFDILNQTRSLTHSVTANYEEDTYRLTMGRYFLLGVKWNFGKADAGHNQRARQAFRAMAL